MLEAIKPAQQQCVVISFDLAAVFRARQIGGVPIGWVLSTTMQHSRLKYEALQPEFLFCDQETCRPTARSGAAPGTGSSTRSITLQLALALAAARRASHRDHGGAADELQADARRCRPA